MNNCTTAPDLVLSNDKEGADILPPPPLKPVRLVQWRRSLADTPWEDSAE
jgi:hypothetical protein